MHKMIVLQTDFGLADGAVNAMVGVIAAVDPTIAIHHLTHEILPFDIFSGAYRLYQSILYWPQGTMFVSVVDPTVGNENRSVFAKLKSGHTIVTPDNGTLTFLKKYIGIDQAFVIDKGKNLYPFFSESYTFFGRDLYAYTAARFVSGSITEADIGPAIAISEIHELEIRTAKRYRDVIEGCVDILDVRFGSLWTNIPKKLFDELGIKLYEMALVEVRHHGNIYFNEEVRVGQAFHDVPKNAPVLYNNSLSRIGLALNLGDFSKTYGVLWGQDWIITIQKT